MQELGTLLKSQGAIRTAVSSDLCDSQRKTAGVVDLLSASLRRKGVGWGGGVGEPMVVPSNGFNG